MEVNIIVWRCCFDILVLIFLFVTFRLCCIAPILAAKVLPGCQVTVGHSTEDGGKWPFAGTAEAINSMGATHVNKDVTISLLHTVQPHNHSSSE